MKTAAKQAEKKDGRGGYREGSGRKIVSAEGRTRIVNATVPARLIAQLDAICEERGLTRSLAITDAIRRYLARR